MSADIMAAHDWSTNGHLIWDLVRLGYLHAEDYTLDTTYGRGVWWKLWQPKRLLTNGWTDDPSQPPTDTVRDFSDLDYPDNHFDTVEAMHIVSVVPEPEKVVAEMARVCKPGGEVVIVNHFARDKGALAMLERLAAPLENMLRWHSNFPMERVLGAPCLSIASEDRFPPLGMMTFLVLRKDAGTARLS